MKPAIAVICFVMSFSSLPLNAQTQPAKGQASVTADERQSAKALDADLAKQCLVSRKQCQRANAILLFQAQVRFADWGYGTKITAEADADTTAAIRLYQERNGLPDTGKINGLTVVRMDADEKAVEAYPFTLPSFEFPGAWPMSFFTVNGVFSVTHQSDKPPAPFK